MASLIETLVDVLSKESDEYEKLVQIASDKSLAIASENIDQVQSITDKEQEFIERIGKLERERQTALRDIALVTNKSVDDITVKTLVEDLKSQLEEQIRLSVVRDRLKKLLDRLSEINKYNQVLLEDALQHIDFSINLYQSMNRGPELNNYDKGAGDARSMNSNSMFDAKQ